MKNKYFILAVTFLCLLVGQKSYSQDWLDDIWDATEDGTNSSWESNGSGGFTETDFNYSDVDFGYFGSDYEVVMDDNQYESWLNNGGWQDQQGHSSQDMTHSDNQTDNHVVEFNHEEPTYEELYGDLIDPYGPYEAQVEVDDQYPDDDYDTASTDNGPVDIPHHDWNTNYGYIDASGGVHIKSSDGTYKLPSQLNPNSDADKKALNQMAAALASNLDGLNKGIIIVSSPGTSLSSESSASTLGTTITLNSNGGFSDNLNDVNNFKSVLKHEIFHVDNNRIPGFIKTLSNHADVYLKQIKDPTFATTTTDFKINTVASLANYLMNMNRDTPQGNYDIITINNLINSFNLLNTGYRIDYPRPAIGLFTGKNLQLNVYKPGDTYPYPVPFKEEKR